MTLKVGDVCFDQIYAGPEQPDGVYRHNASTSLSGRFKKSVFNLVNVQKDLGKELVDVEVKYDTKLKKGFLEVKYRDGTKP